MKGVPYTHSGAEHRFCREEDGFPAACPEHVCDDMANYEDCPEFDRTEVDLLSEQERRGNKRVELQGEDEENDRLPRSPTADVPTSRTLHPGESIDLLDESPVSLGRLVYRHICEVQYEREHHHGDEALDGAKSEQDCRVDDEVDPVVDGLPQDKPSGLVEMFDPLLEETGNEENEERDQ